MAVKSQMSVPSRWYRVLEYLLFAIPVLMGVVFGSVVLTFLDPNGTNPMLAVGGGSYLLLILLGLVSAFVTPVVLYLDARAVNRTGGEWQPTTVLYVVGGFFLSGLTTLQYLYVRNRNVAMPVARSNWWSLVPVGLVGGPLLAFAGMQFSGLAGGVLLVVAGLLLGLVPVAFYRDAGHVRSVSDDWQPDPVTYFFVAALGLGLVPLGYVLSFYYLYQRHRYVGTP